MLDFYEAIKYVSANAEDLGVDPARIAMAGESGGGYVCSGAMVQLALKEEASIVRIAIAILILILIPINMQTVIGLMMFYLPI